jgi:fumarylacetoacetase
MSHLSLNETHDPSLRSWLASANSDKTDFPIQNLPFGCYRAPIGNNKEHFGQPTGGVAIGDQVFDLAAASKAGLFSGAAASAALAAAQPNLNAFMAMGQPAWSALRKSLSQILREGAAQQAMAKACLIAQSKVQMCMPARIGDYTDFFASVFHATNVGTLFRPDSPLMPNYKHVPIAYHGRASSIRISGNTIKRPTGQTMPPGATEPIFIASKRLDYELEMGIWIGPGNVLGEAVKIDDAHEHIFGMCLLNDWSARDIQAWEYQPLGPFLAKNFATSISPWIVTMEALLPFRCPLYARPEGDPQPLPYLRATDLQISGGIDITLDVYMQTQQMRDASQAAHRLSRGSLKHLYWSVEQMVAHHTVGGCNLESGDLFGTGTVSGPNADELGCLLEMTHGGKQPISLPNGEQRAFLLDGDQITFKARCERDGFRSIGMGECSGEIISAAY